MKKKSVFVHCNRYVDVEMNGMIQYITLIYCVQFGCGPRPTSKQNRKHLYVDFCPHFDGQRQRLRLQ